MWRSAVVSVVYEDLPAVVETLQRVEIESNEVIEEIALDLTTKYEYFRA